MLRKKLDDLERTQQELEAYNRDLEIAQKDLEEKRLAAENSAQMEASERETKVNICLTT